MSLDGKLNVELLILRIIFLFLPLFGFILLLPTEVSKSVEFASTSGNFSSDFLWNSETEKSTLAVRSNVDPSFNSKFNYLLGKKLDLSIISLCFINKGTKYNDTDASSFDGFVIVDGISKVTLSYNGTVCHELSPNKEQHSIEIYTKYQYSGRDEKRMNNEGLDLSNNLNLDVKPRLNWSNFLLSWFVLLVGWWSLMWLITRVIVVTTKGLELKKKV